MLRYVCILPWVIAALPVRAAVFEETFVTDPTARGWRTFGDTSLFNWNSTDQNLEVTWDSSRSNSYFHVPLGTTLTKGDSFSFSFDVRLGDIRLGHTPNKPHEFQIAMGLFNYASATRTNFFVGSGTSSLYGIRNAVEFNYFPDAGFGDTFATIVASTNNDIYYAHNIDLHMTPGDTFRLVLSYTASDQILRTSATRNGLPFGLPPNQILSDLSLAGRKDFRADSFGIISYSDAGQGFFPGSVLAHGTVDNVQLVVPEPPVSSLHLSFAKSAWHAQFMSATNWSYTLERSADLVSWSPASPAAAGTGAALSLQDAETPVPNAFYRVRAERL
jgi:hypothetical protein